MAGYADETYGLPVPTIVVVVAGETIRWIDGCPNSTTRIQPVCVLAAITSIG
jgi:hypothetical protein